MTLIKSISGIRGTIGGRSGDNLTPIDIVEFAAAYSSFIRKGEDHGKVVVGRDGRITGLQVKHLVINTLIMSGIDVIDLDLTTTPTAEMAVVKHKAHGGIIISASHNPMSWNALKFLNRRGEFLSAADGRDILKSIDSRDYSFVNHEKQGKITIDNHAIKEHIEEILNLDVIDVQAIMNNKFHVIVDPVNSTGSIAIPLLLDKLNCTYQIINGDIKGVFNHVAEPKPENLTELCAAVQNSNADLGIAVDPDVDRLAFVDENGVFIGEEYTLVLAADFILEKDKGPTVSNLSSTRALADLSQKYDCPYYASAVGEVNVVEKMREVGAVIGGEGNGGVIYPELHYGRDGLLGIAMTLNLIANRGKTLSQLRAGYAHYEIIKDKVDIKPDLDIDKLLANVHKKYEHENISREDGLKIDFAQGWVHMRKSNTEPIIRIYAEAKTVEIAKGLVNPIKEYVKTQI